MKGRKMNQSPVSYCPQSVPAQSQPCQSQLSYNAVKIDIHNPKVMDGQPGCNTQYGMPTNQYYAYPPSNSVPNYPGYYVPQQPVQQPPAVPQPVQQTQQQQTIPQQLQQPVVPQPIQQAQPQPVVPQPVQQVPIPANNAPVQQVINNGIPATQNIVQNPGTQPGQEIITPQQVNPAVPQTQVNTTQPQNTMPAYDISPVLNGLKSTNMVEQADALEKMGIIATEKPDEVKNYLDPQVLDALLGILHADTTGLAGPTQEQEAARAKLIKEMELPDKDQTISPQEKQLAMTLSPKELADKNKQQAMYSIAILQRTLSDEFENKKGEKLSIEKLQAIDHIVTIVKADPNPVLRASALVALAHLNKEEYKPVLLDILTLAQKDKDPNVRDVATEAIERVKNNVNGSGQAS